MILEHMLVYVYSGEIIVKEDGENIVVRKGDLFEIDTVKPYPQDYNETTDVAMTEKRMNACPELTKSVENMDQYDVVFLGYPNWWNTFPMAVFTFL